MGRGGQQMVKSTTTPPCLPITPHRPATVSLDRAHLGGVVDRAVFINYRGEDSRSYSALLYMELVRQFGDEYVFLDAESIPAGVDFVRELLGRVRSARVLLAVIGPRWLTVMDDTGRRRIDDPTDWIRRELTEAFTAGVRVIPMLTDQAELPREDQLPADIAALSRCQYRHLRDREPTTDLARIVTDLTSLDPTLAAAARSRNIMADVSRSTSDSRDVTVYRQWVAGGSGGAQGPGAGMTVNHNYAPGTPPPSAADSGSGQA
jgi:hypothetical protein